MIFVVRHGERADDTFKKAEKDRILANFDPHLTGLGFLQSQLAGRTIKKFSDECIERQNLKTKDMKFIVVSSPFLRCIQTAGEISKSIGIDSIYKNKVYVHSGASEILLQKWFKSTINNDLLIKTKSKEELSELITTDISWGLDDDTFQLEPEYPEDFQHFLRRFTYFFNYTRDWFLSSFSPEEYALVIVTHKIGVQAVLYSLLEFNSPTETDFSAITGLYYSKDDHEKPVMFVKQYAEHIRSISEHGPFPKL